MANQGLERLGDDIPPDQCNNTNGYETAQTVHRIAIFSALIIRCFAALYSSFAAFNFSSSNWQITDQSQFKQKELEPS